MKLCSWTMALVCAAAVACRSGTGGEYSADGYTALFDGRTLDGWVTRGGRYDGNATWTVEDGAITGRVGPLNEGGLLYTGQAYASFELELEARLDHPFDSGIFVRMLPPGQGQGAQVTIDDREGGEIAAIYSDEFLAHNTEAARLFRRGGWNHFRVRCTGEDMHIEVWLNGTMVMDYRLPDGSQGYAPSGRIGVQVHGARDDPPSHRAQFRKVRIRELR